MSDFENNDFNETGDFASYSQQPENNGKAFAIVSLVCGIVSLLFICCTYIGLIVAVTSIVFGILSIKRGENAKGMAIAGIVCSSIAAVTIIIILIAASSMDQEAVMNVIRDEMDINL